jgi:hypothetical protein
MGHRIQASLSIKLTKARGMAQVVEHLPHKPKGPKFKPQYCQKKKKKNLGERGRPKMIGDASC